MHRIRHITWLAVVIGVLALAPAASADYRQAITDCAADGQLHHQYSQSDLRQAIGHLPSSIKEYTDCYDVLNRALNGGGSNPGLPFNPALVTPSGAVAGSQRDLRALHALRGNPSVRVAGQTVVPGTAAIRLSASTLPLPLLLSLIAIAAAAAAAGALAMRQRWPQARRLALRILRR
ncbi:MAG: hypothetical protein NVS2B9_11250 [Myxococcales bacterium]